MKEMSFAATSFGVTASCGSGCRSKLTATGEGQLEGATRSEPRATSHETETFEAWRTKG